MLLYLDTRDLINMLEKDEPFSTEDLRSRLLVGGHQLVVSWALVAELSAPLIFPKRKTSVMRILNLLEELPLAFIADIKIRHLEQRDALAAWSEQRECNSIDPFVPRIDYTLPVTGPPATYLQLTCPIAEVVWDFFNDNPDFLRGHKQHLAELRQWVSGDRASPNLPELKDHFPTVLERDLRVFGLSVPSDLTSFSSWLWSKPSRCPSVRLGLEVYQSIVQDQNYTPEASLFEDYSHLICLPYVDLMTLDRQMADYVRRACRAAALPYGGKIHTRASEAILHLN